MSGGERKLPAAADPRLACYIQYLDPTPRGLRACRQLKIKTVGDFLNRDQAEFLALRNCGKGTYKDLCDRVHRFLTNQEPRLLPTGDHMQRPLRDLVDNPRALRAFQSLGISTVGEFLAIPKDRLLETQGFGERTYWQVRERIRAVAGHGPRGRELLPAVLLDFSLAGLPLSTSLRQRLAELGMDTVRNVFDVPVEVLAHEQTVGEAGLEELRSALDQLIRAGTDQAAGQRDSSQDFARFVSQLLGALDHPQQLLLRQRLGLDRSPRRLQEIAADLRLTHEQALALERDTRLALHHHNPELLTRLREEAEREHRAFEGMLRADQLAAGTILHSAVKSTGDTLLPLRLLRFCFPRVFYLYGELLTKIPPAIWRRFRTVLKHYSNPKLLPVPLYEVELHVSAIIDPIPRGLMIYLLRERHHLAITIDPRQGEVLERVRNAVADRLHAILETAGAPTSAEDLLFTFRDRHGHARMDHILESLRTDERFLEVARQQWGLRAHSRQVLQTAASEAEHIARHIVTQGRRHNIFAIGTQHGLPEHTVYLVIDCLRRNSSLRYLGRGEFCPATVKMSGVMKKIVRDFQRAMGAVVFSRFLRNQKRDRRRLIHRLLTANRMFVEPGPDRIDLLSNYPFNEGRMRRLLATVGRYLDQHASHASALDLIEHLNDTDLGGGWLTEHLLTDILRRNSSFELLPGGLVAQRSLGLGGWIQHRAREALREMGTALTIGEVLAEHPELAAFEECLAELLGNDPMVVSDDGIHYRVV